jgi:hypothetical protein
MELNGKTNSDLSTFLDLKSNNVCISVSVQTDARVSLDDLKKLGAASVQSENLIEAIVEELGRHLYPALRKHLTDILKDVQ